MSIPTTPSFYVKSSKGWIRSIDASASIDDAAYTLAASAAQLFSPDWVKFWNRINSHTNQEFTLVAETKICPKPNFAWLPTNPVLPTTTLVRISEVQNEKSGEKVSKYELILPEGIQEMAPFWEEKFEQTFPNWTKTLIPITVPIKKESTSALEIGEKMKEFSEIVDDKSGEGTLSRTLHLTRKAKEIKNDIIHTFGV